MTRTEAEWASWAREHRDRMGRIEKRLLAFGVKQGRA
jgi:hypothetical protein